MKFDDFPWKKKKQGLSFPGLSFPRLSFLGLSFPVLGLRSLIGLSFPDTPVR